MQREKTIGYQAGLKTLRRLRDGALSAWYTTKRSVTRQYFEPPAHKILIGTHHKTGTVWMRRTFLRACMKLGFRFYSGPQQELPERANVFLQNHSHFDLEGLGSPYRGVHIIRDPRDRLVSGCFFHQKSLEPWLHSKQSRFGGLSYQEKLNSYDSFDDKLLFEMEEAGRHCIEEMKGWQYDNPSFIEIKYEDLVQDYQLLLFHKIFSFLGFPGESIPIVLQTAYENSLFSGKKKKSGHVRSGKAAQWPSYFTRAHVVRFNELFPDILIELGYEADDDWIKDY